MAWSTFTEYVLIKMVQKVQMENVLLFFLADKRILKQAKINKKITLAHSMVNFSKKEIIFKKECFFFFFSTNISRKLFWEDELIKVNKSLLLRGLASKQFEKFILSSIVWVHRCTQGRGRGEGVIKVYPPSKMFAKLVNKNAIKHQKGVPSPRYFKLIFK